MRESHRAPHCGGFCAPRRGLAGDSAPHCARGERAALSARGWVLLSGLRRFHAAPGSVRGQHQAMRGVCGGGRDVCTRRPGVCGARPALCAPGGGSARGAVRGRPGGAQSRSAAPCGERSRQQPPALLAASGPVRRAAGRGFCARSHASAGINGRRRAAPLQASSPPLRLAEQRPQQPGERWIPRTVLALPVSDSSRCGE